MGQAKQLRVGMLVPAAVLLAGGFAVTFTQTLHHLLVFNAWLSAAVLAMLTVVHFGINAKASPDAKRPGALALALTSAAAAIGAAVAALVPSEPLLIVVLLGWAAVTATIELFPSIRLRNRESLALGVLAALLALALVGLARDVTMAVGLFSAYCILAGVYLAIGAFERSPINSGQQAPAAGENRL